MLVFYGFLIQPIAPVFDYPIPRYSYYLFYLFKCTVAIISVLFYTIIWNLDFVAAGFTTAAGANSVALFDPVERAAVASLRVHDVVSLQAGGLCSPLLSDDLHSGALSFVHCLCSLA